MRKGNVLLVSGMLAAVLAFAFVMTGCASTAQTTNRADSAVAYYNRGVAYFEKGDWDNAIAEFTEAIRLKPDFASAYYNLSAAYYNRGVVYAEKEDYARARADWEKVLEIDPNHAGARNNLERLKAQGH
jgi:tetratricopeptide (TPR) repeat protein